MQLIGLTVRWRTPDVLWLDMEEEEVVQVYNVTLSWRRTTTRKGWRRRPVRRKKYNPEGRRGDQTEAVVKQEAKIRC
jgi:hypothetical protein